ncbi:MAG: GntR family transcriptional regulator [Verrucomicrobiae bacterium]|nr:GntR family transcriptional regulator [Verrucomicrobiae bacterium]
MDEGFNFVLQTADPVHVQIERFFRNQILNGKLKTGDRFPPTADLVRQWHVDQMSIQRAMKPLVDEGLIQRLPKRGTCVCRGVSKSVMAILVGARLVDETSHFQRAMIRALESQMPALERGPWTHRIYDGLSALKSQADFQHSVAYENLCGDLRNYPFKGVILIPGAAFDMDWLGPDFSLPVVRYQSSLKKAPSDVVLDFADFGRQVVRFIASRGLKRIVYLRTLTERDTFMSSDLEGMREAARTADIPQPTVWPIPFDRINVAGMEKSAREITLQLLDQWRNEGIRPEAIIVSDDIAARGVALALTQRGLKIPEGLLLATMANEGIDLHDGAPVVRYEFSPEVIMTYLCQILLKRLCHEALDHLSICIPGRLVLNEAPALARSQNIPCLPQKTMKTEAQKTPRDRWTKRTDSKTKLNSVNQQGANSVSHHR